MPSATPTPIPAPGYQGPNHAPPNPSDARYTHILDDLIDRGAALARRIHETAMADTTPAATVAEATVAFDRISRCVRRTVALARHIAAHPAPDAHSNTQANTRTQARARIIRQVENAIVTHTRVTRVTKPEIDGLRAELAERLDDPALEFDLEDRPVDDIIAEICQDLGIARQGRSYVYQRRTPADVQALRETAAARPRPPPPASHGVPARENIPQPNRLSWLPDP